MCPTGTAHFLECAERFAQPLGRFVSAPGLAPPLAVEQKGTRTFERYPGAVMQPQCALEDQVNIAIAGEQHAAAGRGGLAPSSPGVLRGGLEPFSDRGGKVTLPKPQVRLG